MSINCAHCGNQLPNKGEPVRSGCTIGSLIICNHCRGHTIFKFSTSQVIKVSNIDGDNINVENGMIFKRYRRKK